ncbi:MAG: hypothetical protein QXK03_04545 [Archaeoglobaceae archaeon]
MRELRDAETAFTETSVEVLVQRRFTLKMALFSAKAHTASFIKL